MVTEVLEVGNTREGRRERGSAVVDDGLELGNGRLEKVHQKHGRVSIPVALAAWPVATPRVMAADASTKLQ